MKKRCIRGMKPPPPVKILKICNPHNPKRNFADDILGMFVPKKKIENGTIAAVDRWGNQDMVLRTSPFKCPWNFIARLEKRGYKVLGRGAYSTVLCKDGSDRVIKVSRSLDDWIDYIQWGAKNGYAGNFVPRVYSWKRHCRSDVGEWANKDWSVAVVERMKDTISDQKYDLSLLLDLHYPARAGNVMAKLYMDDLCPGSMEFFEELEKNHFNSDVFGKNVMIRENGTLCVTDPTCGQIKTTKLRFRTNDLSCGNSSFMNLKCPIKIQKIKEYSQENGIVRILKKLCLPVQRKEHLNMA